ncbi:uncharacterized protein EAE98_009416 [Botrytis deweyae]|uniref:Uncharacterized protein n=2 Tax=Botrytis TaxID=33196 RepID=A0A4Z1K675_9HELO|nr:uncharacterized protein EAE98_009416 [Botrytis deweyae]KAF7919096.1 hypothetical protein EAE98_009416 [Botrytis deweyae]TGO76837.1 hypothetical protein BELL_0134g00090 [Botrytis elliptica]
MHFQSLCFASATLVIAIMAAPIIESSSLAAREAGVPRGFFNNNDVGSEVKRGFFNNADASDASKEKRGFFNNNDAGSDVKRGFFNNADASGASKEKRGFFNNNDVSDSSKAKRGFFNNGVSTAEVSKRDEEVDDDGYYYTYTDSSK